MTHGDRDPVCSRWHACVCAAAVNLHVWVLLRTCVRACCWRTCWRTCRTHTLPQHARQLQHAQILLAGCMYAHQLPHARMLSARAHGRVSCRLNALTNIGRHMHTCASDQPHARQPSFHAKLLSQATLLGSAKLPASKLCYILGPSFLAKPAGRAAGRVKHLRLATGTLAGYQAMLQR